MKHIYQEVNGWRVDIRRVDMKFRCFVAWGHDRAAALAKAKGLRDEFLAVHGTFCSHSNTGVMGVTELTHWTRGTPQNCFVVTFGSPRPNWKHRFFYKTFSQRQRQLEAAIRCRARLAGEPVAQLLEAAHV